MSKNRETKKEVVREISEKIQKAQSAVLVDYRGLNVEEITKFRAEARKSDVDYKIYKNTMVKFAVKENGYDELLPYLVGPSAIAFSYDDPIIASKIVADFTKQHKQMEIKAGLVDGKVLDKSGVMELAELPSKEILMAKALGGLNAPISGLVGVLNANIRGLTVALNQIKEQREATA